MIELAQKAVKAISEYRENKEIMNFVTQQALEKVSSEMNAKGLSTTAKGVSLLIMSKKNSNIKARVDHYVDAGLFGCWMAAQ